jgi:rod shape determining protein RodA
MPLGQSSLFKRFNIYMIFCILSLNAIALINLLSATTNIAKHLKGIFYSQMIWIAIGWGLYWLLTFINYRFFVRFAYFFYVLNILALIAVMFIGKTSYGAQRWINLGFFSYQPSETMKLAMILILAKHLSQFNPSQGIGFRDLFTPLLLDSYHFGVYDSNHASANACFNYRTLCGLNCWASSMAICPETLSKKSSYDFFIP